MKKCSICSFDIEVEPPRACDGGHCDECCECPDLLVLDQGTVWLFQFVSEYSRRWWDENVQDGPTLGPNPVVEHRYALDIVRGARDQGLNVEVR